MIDEERTYEEFGYRSTDLTFGSNKKVIAVCEGVDCENSEREVSFQGYHDLCLSCAKKKSYQDNPEIRKKLSRSHKKLNQENPDRGQKHSEFMKQLYQDDPDRKQKISESMKKYYEDHPEVIELISERIKKYWKEHPEVIELMSKNRKKYNKDHPEVIELMSKIMKKYIEDNPEIKEKQSERMKKFYEDPEERKKASARQQGISIDEWTGFLSFKKYCYKFNKLLKIEIRDNYNDCDFISGIHKSICNVMNGKVHELDVHHIDYDKMQGCDDKKWYLIPLSRSNHSKTNKNRSFWNRLFMYALEYDKEYYNMDEPKGLYRVKLNDYKLINKSD